MATILILDDLPENVKEQLSLQGRDDLHILAALESDLEPAVLRERLSAALEASQPRADGRTPTLSTMRREVALFLVGWALLLIAAYFFDVFESFSAVLAKDNLFDELFFSLVYLGCGFAIFSWRRARDARVELTERVRAQNALHELHSGLEQRVDERTADLANANSALQKEINERRQAEEALRESERTFATLFEKTSYAISLSSLPHGIIVNINESFEKTFGHTRQEAIGKTSLELGINPNAEDRARILADLNEHGSARNIELVLYTKAKEARIFSINVDFVEISGQKYILNSTLDITERKHAESRLAYQARLLENVNDAVLATDVDFRLTSWNRAAQELYGYSEGEVLGRTAQEILRSDFTDEQRATAIRALRQNGSYRSEVVQYHRNGQAFWAEGNTFALRESDGQISGFVSINRDVTKRKRAEQQVQRQLKQLNALRVIDMAISSSFDLYLILEIVLQQVIAHLGVDAAAVLLYDPESRIIEYAASYGFQSSALRYTKLNLGEGYASQAILEGRTIHISALMDTGGKLAQALQAASEEFGEYYGAPLIVKGEVKGVLEIYHRAQLRVDSEWLEFLETLAGEAAIAINDAQLVERLQHSNLQLEQRVAERTAELQRTNQELERANRAKDEFLATMSHELRTPLTSILGLSESLLEQRRGSLDPRQQMSLEIIGASGSHLLELINDILDLSKIDAGKFDFYGQPLAVDELCRSSLAFVKAQALKKSINIVYRNELRVARIYADPRRMKQILVNLLTNAVKFTLEYGQITLEVQADPEQDLIQFSVIDTGIGIAPEDLPRLFQPFVQLDSRLNRMYDGTGLGLALVQKLTDLHGGSIELESTPGQGSRFTVNLPIRQGELDALEGTAESAAGNAGQNGSQDPSSVQRGVVLLAEDNMANVITVSEYLESYGYEVIVAHDGAEAVVQAESSLPDIILMDIQMPVMDGLEAIARLRQDANLATTPIIALTALAMPGDRERCLVAGASEYLSKPVSLKSLLTTIEQLLPPQDN